jgi:group II intron reverse transcriptase/maturase
MQRDPIATLTELERIAARARRDSSARFVNLMHLLSAEFLAACFQELRKDAAPGIDGVTWQTFAEDLPQQLAHIVDWVKRGQYWPQPVRRVHIPKDEHSTRPLGLPTLRDKLVQLALTKILTAIFEGDFLPVSYGYRPGRNAHQALQALETCLGTCPMTTVIDADLTAFFDSVDHAKLRIALEQRVADRKFLRLIDRFLAAGILEDGHVQATTQGTPQGGILSPILSNIFLHYVLDRWLTHTVFPRLAGDAALIRYADDFVVCLQDAEEACGVVRMIRERLQRCGLQLSEQKTRVLSFGRTAWRHWRAGGAKPETFDFLGFTHYVTTTRSGYFRVGRTTCRKNFRRSLRALKAWLRQVRHVPLKEWWGRLKAKLQGHYQYYGVCGNFAALVRYAYEVRRLLARILVTRSQRGRSLWPWLVRYLERYPLPRPRITCTWYTSTRAGGC